MGPPEVVGGEDRNQRRANRQGHGDQRFRKLQDWRSLAPIGGDELDRDGARQDRGAKYDSVGERETNQLTSLWQQSENKVDMGVLTASIRDRAADERHH